MTSRKCRAPPPPPPSSSEKSSSSAASDEEQEEAEVTTQTRNKQKISIQNSNNEAESESESETEEKEDEEEEDDEEKEEPEPQPKSVPQKEDPKRNKKNNKPESKQEQKKEQSTGKGGDSIRRVFAPQAELAILGFLADFRTKNNSFPSNNDYESFIPSLRGLVKNDITSTQILTKVKHLKQRRKSLSRKLDKGEHLESHDLAIYEASNKVWGRETKNSGASGAGDRDAGISTENEGGVSTGGRGKSSVLPELKQNKLLLYPYLQEAVDDLGKQNLLGSVQLKRAFELLDESKARDLEKKYKNQKYQEWGMCCKRMKLDREAFAALVRVLKRHN